MYFPLHGGEEVIPFCERPGTSSASVPVPTGGSHTKGAWTTIVPYCPVNAHSFIFQVMDYKVAAWDIAIGPVGEERIIVADLISGMGSVQEVNNFSRHFPLPIQKGERIAARWQGADNTYDHLCSILPIGGGFGRIQPIGVCRTYGFVPASTKGVDVDCGATANTKGAWVKVVPYVPFNMRAFVGAFNHAAATGSTVNFLIDWAYIPPGGSNETIFIPDWWIQERSSYENTEHLIGPVFYNIPKGSAIYTRGQCNDTTATYRTWDAVAYILG